MDPHSASVIRVGGFIYERIASTRIRVRSRSCVELKNSLVGWGSLWSNFRRSCHDCEPAALLVRAENSVRVLRGAVRHGAHRRAIVVELLGEEFLLHAEALVVQGGNLLFVVRGLVEVCRGLRRDAVGAIAKFVVVIGNAAWYCERLAAGQRTDQGVAHLGDGW